MKLFEIAEKSITVRVDKEFSEFTFDFDFDEHYEDIREVPEPLKPLVQVITPIEDDYRGASMHSSMYEGEPELAYDVGEKTGKVYQQDLLNLPATVFRLSQLTPESFMKFLHQHIVTHKPADVGAKRMH